MSKKRTRTQILAEILAICQEGNVNKTKIVYQANLNFQNAGYFLDMLIAKGLLEDTRDKLILYKTTVKGKQALKNLKNTEDICS